jgi:hypothetical protein
MWHAVHRSRNWIISQFLLARRVPALHLNGRKAREQMKCWRLESETLQLFMFSDRAKRLTPRMWLNAQFFVVEGVHEALKNTNERAMLRNLEERDRVIRDLALV